MSNFAHVSFSFPGVPKVLDLEPVFSSLGDWVRISNTQWILWTDYSVQQIYHSLAQRLDPQDLFAISVPLYGGFGGRLPEWIWHWMDSKRPGEFTYAPSSPPPDLFLPGPGWKTP